MGFIRRVTGAQKQMDAMNRNADIQITAAKTAADSQAKALNDAAQATAENQAQNAARAQAEAAARDAVSKPLDVVDVALDAPQTGSAIGAARKKRAQFGQGVTGVSI